MPIHDVYNPYAKPKTHISQVLEANYGFSFLLKFTESNLEYCHCIYYANRTIYMMGGNIIHDRIGMSFTICRPILEKINS